MRRISYARSINEALDQIMEADERVFLMGQGLDSPWSFGTTTLGLSDKYGPRRCFDPPTSENGVTGIGIGAAMVGMRPVVMHARMDFMYLCMDQIFNHAAVWYYMFDGKCHVPIVIRGVINRGNEQAAQHSQSPYAMYAHVPGLKVVMPSNPRDAKGLLIAAIRDPNPVIYIDDRWLYDHEGEVQEDLYETPIGAGNVAVEGTDVTVVALGYMVPEAIMAAEQLRSEGISVEVVDPRTVKPLDSELIVESVKKTRKLLVADPAWPFAGVAAEICCQVVEKGFSFLDRAPVRVTQPDTPIPASIALEKGFYRGAGDIVSGIRKVLA